MQTDKLIYVEVTKPKKMIYHDIGQTFECRAYLIVRSQESDGDIIRVRLLTRNGASYERAAIEIEQALDEMLPCVEFSYT